MAKALGYAQPRNAIRDHCKGALKRCSLTPGGMQSLSFIPERDVYRLVMRSRLPSAERFEEWVVATVLPSIRKHGGYVANQESITDPRLIMANALKVADSILAEKDKILAEQKAQITVLEPKAAIVDETFVHDDQAIPLSNFARTLPHLTSPHLTHPSPQT